MKNKSILITTYNRVKELETSINALLKCINFENYKLVIVYHEEISTTKDYVEKLKINNLFCLPVNGAGKSALENMNHNRIYGLDYCFSNLNSDFVIAIEDDILIGFDALYFSEKILSIYRGNLFFRGVNLGSKEKLSDLNKFIYGKFRFGLFGQGSLITSEQWNTIKSLNIFSNIKRTGFDSLVEDYYKTGFVIMPYASRYLDIGWNGTHTPKDPLDVYYTSLKNSWVGSDEFELLNYTLKNQSYNWRDDCIKYNYIDNFKYFIMFVKFYFSIKLNGLKNRNY